MTFRVHEREVRSAAIGFAYDVFVVHAAAPADEAFVNGYLLAQLDLAPGRVLQMQTLELGRVLLEEIERGVRSSRVTVVVLSAAYMDDPSLAVGEQLAAYASVASDGRGALLPLLLEDCKLTMYVQSLVKLDFRDPSRARWDAEIERLRRYLDRPTVQAEQLNCPYPGMRPFRAGDAAVFFGREVELENILYRLRHGEREIYVIGASGSGKSSLINAGLIPRLARGVVGLPRFLVRGVRPGEQPVERLAAALERDVAGFTESVEAVRVDPVERLLAPQPPATGLLVVIDQLEEVFTLASDPQRRAFFAAVRALRVDPRCVLLFTLRADFYGAFMTSALWNDGRISRVDLGPLSRDSLRVAIERPARDAGVHVEPQLVSRLLDDAAREPGALPLLQETLRQLWARRRRRLLALEDYRALNNGASTGLAFAVGQHADLVLGRLTSAEKAIALRILIRLVNFGEGRADTRRQQPRDALRSHGENAEDFAAVLRLLVDQRLVTVTGDDRRGEVRVDLAHEVLIEAWPVFTDRISGWRSLEQRRRELEMAAVGWRARGSGDGGVLDAVELAGAIAWRARAGDELGYTSDLAAFLAASEAAHDDALRREVEQREQRNRVLAESSRLYREIGRQLLVELKRPLEALPYLVAARVASEAVGIETGTPLRMLFAQAIQGCPLSPALRHPASLLGAEFCPDGVHVVVASEGNAAHVWNAVSGQPISIMREHQSSVRSAVFSPDGARVATASEDGTARIWDVVSGTPISLPLQHQGPVMSVAFSPDGARVVTASWDRTAQVWDACSGQPLSPPLIHEHHVDTAAFNRDGTCVVTASWDRTARVWDARSGRQLLPPLKHRHRVSSAVFSDDGGYIATASWDCTACVWDAGSGRLRSSPVRHRDVVNSAVFNRDATRIVTASRDRTARVWDADSGRPVSPPLLHLDSVKFAAFSRDGRRVVTASRDRTARVWDAASGRPLLPLLRHQDTVRSAVFSPDGTRILTASRDRTARLWDASEMPCSPPLEHQGAVRSAAFNRDGNRVVTASRDHTARVWDADSGRPVSPPLRHRGAVTTAAFSPDGRRVVTASWDETAQVWDAVSGSPLSPPLQHQGTVMSAAFSPGGDRVITASWDETARVWDAVSGRPLLSLLDHNGPVRYAAFSPDGTLVITVSKDKRARVWYATSGLPVSPLLEHSAAVSSAAFSPDGARVVTTSWDGTARMWDVRSGSLLMPPIEHQGAVMSAAFHPAGTSIVTASLDGTARTWSAASGKPLSAPILHHGPVASAEFSPDGLRVVTASEDGTACIWDAGSSQLLSPPLAHQALVHGAAFSPDGTRVVSASDDHTARIWTMPLASGTLAEWRVIVERAGEHLPVGDSLSIRVRPD